MSETEEDKVVDATRRYDPKKFAVPSGGIKILAQYERGLNNFIRVSLLTSGKKGAPRFNEDIDIRQFFYPVGGETADPIPTKKGVKIPKKDVLSFVTDMIGVLEIQDVDPDVYERFIAEVTRVSGLLK